MKGGLLAVVVIVEYGVGSDRKNISGLGWYGGWSVLLVTEWVRAGIVRGCGFLW